MKRYPKILMSYFFGLNSIPLGSSCARALKALGCDVLCFNSGVDNQVDRFLFKHINKLFRNTGFKEIDLFKNLRWNNQNFRQRLLEKAVIEFNPDILFVVRGHGFDGEYITYLKEKYKIKKIVGWWVKGPKWFDLMQSEADIYDNYFCIHREGYTEKDKISYFPAVAVDDLLYRLASKPDQRRYKQDIVFVGGWTKRRQEFLEKLPDFPIDIYGPKWRKKNIFNFRLRRMIKDKGIWGESLVRLYNTSKIALNISAWNTEKLSGLNLRVFDIPACGTFFITDYSDELREFFKPGEEIETFRDINELNDKVSYYLKNDLERERIALNGYKKVLSLGTVKDKMAVWLNKVWFND